MAHQVGNPLTILVASEHTDPCFHVSAVINQLSHHKEPVGLLLITKDLRRCKPILKHTKDHNIPTLTHATITGLSQTPLEPNTPSTEQSLQSLAQLINDGYLHPSRTVIRIDPLVPKYSKPDTIDHILSTSHKLKITQARISIIDYYPHVLERFKEAGLEYHDNFQLPQDQINNLISNFLGLATQYNIQTYLCAEHYNPVGTLPKNVLKPSNRGCASIEEWQKLGYTVKPAIYKQRTTCTCNALKIEILRSHKGCDHKCLYCYQNKHKV